MVVFHPPRIQHCHIVFGDSLGYGKSQSIVSGHLLRGLLIVNRRRDNRDSQLLQFFQIFLIAGQLPPAVGSPITPIKEERQVPPGKLVGQTYHPVVDELES